MNTKKLLPAAAAVIVVAAAAVTFATSQSGDSGDADDTAALSSTVTAQTEQSADTGSAGEASSDSGAETTTGDIIIDSADLSADASYYDYNADGTTVELFAIKTDDGEVRMALNTCQVCNGSPYAYFEQEDGDFVCQNCGNHFSADQIGESSGGCNPVPVTADDYTEKDGVYTVSAEFLKENADRFTSWKDF